MEEIQYALGLIEQSSIETDIGRMRLVANVHFCEPIDDDPLIAAICYDKIRELSVAPEQEVLLMIGHGSDEPDFGDRWQTILERVTEQVARMGRFAHAGTAMLHPDEIAEKIRWWQSRQPECAIVVAPFFLSEGYFTKKVIPERIGLADGRQTVRYNGQALLPHPNITKWLEKQIAKFL